VCYYKRTIEDTYMSPIRVHCQYLSAYTDPGRDGTLQSHPAPLLSLHQLALIIMALVHLTHRRNTPWPTCIWMRRTHPNPHQTWPLNPELLIWDHPHLAGIPHHTCAMAMHPTPCPPLSTPRLHPFHVPCALCMPALCPLCAMPQASLGLCTAVHAVFYCNTHAFVHDVTCPNHPLPSSKAAIPHMPASRLVIPEPCPVPHASHMFIHSAHPCASPHYRLHIHMTLDPPCIHTLCPSYTSPCMPAFSSVHAHTALAPCPCPCPLSTPNLSMLWHARACPHFCPGHALPPGILCLLKRLCIPTASLGFSLCTPTWPRAIVTCPPSVHGCHATHSHTALHVPYTAMPVHVSSLSIQLQSPSVSIFQSSSCISTVIHAHPQI